MRRKQASKDIHGICYSFNRLSIASALHEEPINILSCPRHKPEMVLAMKAVDIRIYRYIVSKLVVGLLSFGTGHR